MARDRVKPLLKSIRHRVPADAPEEVKALADRALGVLAEVMEGAIPAEEANARLKAAGMIREETCGPVPRDVRLSGAVSLETLVREAAKPEPEEIDPTA